MLSVISHQRESCAQGVHAENGWVSAVCGALGHAPGSLAVCSIASAGAASEAGGLVDDTGGLGSEVTDVTDVTDGGGATIRSLA